MIKELMLMGALLSANIQEPNRAIINNNEYEVINATEGRMIFYQGFSDEEVQVSGKTKIFYPYKVKTDDNWVFSIYKSDYPTKPADFYYIYNAPDYEDPVAVTFSDNYEYWTTTISGYEPSRGLQVGRFESLRGVHAYIDYTKLGITTNQGLPLDTYTNLLPNDVTIKAVGSNGSISGVLQTLQANRSSTQIQGTIHLVVLYGTNNHSYILSQNMTTGSADLQPMLFWLHGLTNEFVFESGNRLVVYGDMEGRLPYYFTNQNQGYLAYDEESVTQAYDTLTTAFEMVATALGLLSSAFGWIIFPGVSIGLLLLIPIIVSLFVWLIRFLKKG